MLAKLPQTETQTIGHHRMPILSDELMEAQKDNRPTPVLHNNLGLLQQQFPDRACREVSHQHHHPRTAPPPPPPGHLFVCRLHATSYTPTPAHSRLCKRWSIKRWLQVGFHTTANFTKARGEQLAAVADSLSKLDRKAVALDPALAGALKTLKSRVDRIEFSKAAR